MMGSVSEEEDQFFDTREDITSVSDFGSDCPENSDSEHAASASSVPANFRVEVWIKNLSSLRERRNKFLKWMGLSGDQTLRESPSNMGCDEIEVETDRIMEESGAVLGSSAFVDGFSSSQSSVSCWSSDVRELLDGAFDDNFLCRIKNLDDGTEFIVDEVSQDGMFKGLREVGSNKLLTIDEFERKLGLSPLVQKAMRWEVKAVSDLGLERKQGRKGWLRRLGAVACIVDRQGDTARMMSGNSYPNGVARIQMVRVRSYKKRSKEFSALYMRQDIQAHEGAILTMKFSPDGQYLASAGEDGVVRVWQVVESESSGNSDIHDVNPSYVYFQVNNFSELVPLHADKEKKEKSKSVKKNSDTICVIFPRKVFRILDKPIHEFHGHCGEVLNLSWSKNKHILSSSIDKTVRLWQVGYDECQKVFFHNNYVTCVQFNPVNDDYFISGSIDGKVRIWAIPGCQVVDWTDVRDIVTAVCYRPDGKGAVIGSMNGNCHFYDASDNCLQLNAQICIHCKKKSPCSRITGLQFSPGDPDILMITSADSQVRILNGIDMVCTMQGARYLRHSPWMECELFQQARILMSMCGTMLNRMGRCPTQRTIGLVNVFSRIMHQSQYLGVGYHVETLLPQIFQELHHHPSICLADGGVMRILVYCSLSRVRAPKTNWDSPLLNVSHWDMDFSRSLCPRVLQPGQRKSFPFQTP
ncbi:WD repeat-containing protein 44-like isoform X2 [Hibiscus syriacus]|uniref:WD repeat-containing protein 44-like isoform X2 n=1 Tax=Hibiscus syriacus TaxID=106335 RepID=UPI0019214231|nr:WD repeat-containing protein 44-like isoform X2 [Hibiscus syriacus]